MPPKPWGLACLGEGWGVWGLVRPSLCCCRHTARLPARDACLLSAGACERGAADPLRRMPGLRERRGAGVCPMFTAMRCSAVRLSFCMSVRPQVV